MRMRSSSMDGLLREMAQNVRVRMMMCPLTVYSVSRCRLASARVCVYVCHVMCVAWSVVVDRCTNFCMFVPRVRVLGDARGKVQ